MIRRRTHNFASKETGSWRTEKPLILLDRCIQCGICIEYCPEGTIVQEDGGIEIDYLFCKGCGICGAECKTHAIEMVREPDEG
ncbi:MAG: 4Fe-4S binding protein [Candidatus Tectomicrobia bacterium]|uniref:4Fe-4S binding protein n=1 Tax=Tectimicrobiota bacterium TaxID=2528274 RepID=A0A932FXE9_UNCTE|nr:4Fe-4S binding protein [Candidatus Tectomicrobia bacterium]